MIFFLIFRRWLLTGTWSHLWFEGIRECPPWCSIVGATVTVHQFFFVFYIIFDLQFRKKNQQAYSVVTMFHNKYLPFYLVILLRFCNNQHVFELHIGAVDRAWFGWVVELNWLFNVTINDISVIYVTAHRCAGGMKKKFDLRSGSQRHRHFVGFFNVPVLAPTRDQPFYTVIPTHRPI